MVGEDAFPGLGGANPAPAIDRTDDPGQDSPAVRGDPHAKDWTVQPQAQPRTLPRAVMRADKDISPAAPVTSASVAEDRAMLKLRISFSPAGRQVLPASRVVQRPASVAAHSTFPVVSNVLVGALRTHDTEEGDVTQALQHALPFPVPPLGLLPLSER